MKVKNRIKKNEDFQRIIRSRNMVKNQYFSCYYEKNDVGFLKAGIGVSKKNGNAVIRNKLKRQVRMMVRELSDMTESINLIIVIRQAYEIEDYEKMKSELGMVFLKIRRNLINEPKA